ncbi:hypothetical protein QLQ15_04125 [Lysobacter sp. LF1]|uniref:Sulfotransferase n=1 Tax=Lysobacter stagni TaxID=3045172 RepID=A0ABT6XD75_9GAMM|nr:hypothetical protein [Lysobacter sp. LF1]MDI9238094.1 hypothetical protein [Lysobacter sp. LF1]
MTAAPIDHPEYLPFKLDPVARRVLWVRLSAPQRREAAFLDDRALPPDAEGGWRPWSSLTTRDGAGVPPAHAIFHIGHCGSTLLSRLLDTWPEVQGLREPLPLRTLAEAWPALDQPQSRLSTMQATQALDALWARWSQPLPPRRVSIVKATSGCNGLIQPLLERHRQMRAVLMAMPLRPYLATLLKSPASVVDAATAAAERLLYLRANAIAQDVSLHALTLPHQCAMGWLAERLRFDALAGGEHGSRLLRLDFEDMLADPARELQRVVAHFQLDPAQLDRALASPEWNRYSKATVHEYGRSDREHDLALAMSKHATQIAEGEAWVAQQLRASGRTV